MQRTDQVIGEHEVRLRSNCAPLHEQGQANIALRNFLASKLKLPKRAIVLQQGERSRDKLTQIDGVTDEAERARLLRTT